MKSQRWAAPRRAAIAALIVVALRGGEALEVSLPAVRDLSHHKAHRAHLRGERRGHSRRHHRLHALAARSVDPAGGFCSDYPRGWKNKSNRTCGDYVAQRWCTEHGQKGPGWTIDSDIEDWPDEEGKSALDACCACGGGMGLKALLGETGTQECSDGVAIRDEKTCAQAARALGAKFAMAANWPIGHPGGCHADADGKTVWLNVQASGTPRDEYAPICASSVGVRHGQVPAKEEEDDEDKKAEKVAEPVPVISPDGPVGSVCVNYPNKWRSTTNHSCQAYEDLAWCLPDGRYGPGWATNGNFSAWAPKDGVSAKEACCACGGGRKRAVVMGKFGSQSCGDGDLIRNENVCKQAAKSLGAKFESAAKWPLGNPAGCHIDEEKKSVWLNTEPNGTPRDEYAPLCAMPPKQVEAVDRAAAEEKSSEAAVEKDEDDDDDDEHEEDDDDRAAPAQPTDLRSLRRAVVKAHAALTKNLGERAELVTRLNKLEDEEASHADSDGVAKEIGNETQAPSLGEVLQSMYLEMRSMGNPFYEERLEGKLERLEKKTPKLEKAYKKARHALHDAEDEEKED